MSESRHIPVLLGEVLTALAPKQGGVYVDGTFGAGGYTRAILAAADARVYAIDRDPEAIAAGTDLAAEARGRLTLINGRFSAMDELLAERNVRDVDGVALDIGVSSMQLDEAARGFSFQHEGPLDMRMSGLGPSAADVINSASEKLIADILFHYGEERRSRAIARAIVSQRREAPITTTKALAEIVERVLGRGGVIHPATRTFQALRIYVNGELHELALGLSAAERILKEEGRLAVVTFHSLEDRIVKSFLTERSGKTESVSRHQPQAARKSAASFTVITRKPIAASSREIERNPRARSAKLRAAIRTGSPALPLNLLKLGLEASPRMEALS
jgi:16S rRNA (cytosine1402-N4)-methyltransferase